MVAHSIGARSALVACAPKYGSDMDDPASQSEMANRQLQRRDYASFLRRLAAYVVDSIILIFVSAIPERMLGDIWNWFAVLIGIGYAIGFIAIGATPGMRILHIHVIDERRGLPGLERSAMRWLIPGLTTLVLQLAVILPNERSSLELSSPLGFLMVLAMIVGSLDCLWILWSDRRQALHDIVADTMVVPDWVIAPEVPNFGT